MRSGWLASWFVMQLSDGGSASMGVDLLLQAGPATVDNNDGDGSLVLDEEYLTARAA